MRTELKTIFKNGMTYIGAAIFVAYVLIAALCDGGFDGNAAASAIQTLALAATVVGVVRFVSLNDGLFDKRAVTLLLSIGLAIYPLGQLLGAVTAAAGSGAEKALLAVSVVALAASVAVLAVMVLKCLVIDFFQPLALDTVTVIILIAGAAVSDIAALVAVINGAYGAAIGYCVGFLATAGMGVVWAKNQPMGAFSGVKGQPINLFRNGEGGYSTFRIPSLCALDRRVLNEKWGYKFDRDVLVAFAEGRKNSSHDTGVVDMLGKISADGGDTWTPLAVMFSYGEEVGKYGNPTMVLDRNSGLLAVAMMSASKRNNFDYDTYFLEGKLLPDLTFEWGEARNISLPKEEGAKGGSDGVRKHTLMVGPGKGVQISQGEHTGRIVIPASNGGNSYAVYSDDGGASWKRGEPAGSGNECEAAELSGGELVMVVRDGAGCTMPHPEQYQKLSYSSDGGQTWHDKECKTPLRTPICMASLAAKGDELAMTYPDSFHTRVDLTLGLSGDCGRTWRTKLLYGGAAGYSCITADSDGNLYVLAEVGKVNYNETLMFMVCEDTLGAQRCEDR